MPHSLWAAISQNQDLAIVNPVLGDVPSSREEVEITPRLRAYDMDHVSLRSLGSFLALEVNGLAEKRPSLYIVIGNDRFSYFFKFKTNNF